MLQPRRHTIALFSFFLFTLVPLLLSAQTYERAFGLEIGAHQGGRRIAGGDLPIQQVERQDSVENGIGGYVLGLIYESRADKIGFTAGVRYLRTGYEVVENGLNGPSIGNDFRDEVNAQYLQLPLELNFHQNITEKDRVLFMLGVAGNIHLKTVTERTRFLDGVDQGTEIIPDDEELNYQPVVLSLNTGIGFDRKLGEDWAVRVMPYFNFFLQGNIKQDLGQLNRNYYQTGVRVTVKRVFL